MTNKIVVIGGSTGSSDVIKAILSPLPYDFAWPILVVQHQLASAKDYLLQHIHSISKIHVKYAADGERPIGGTAYFASPNHHLLLDPQGRLSLNQDAPIRHSRPSIDCLFGSAVAVFKSEVVGVLLSGANEDGVKGMISIDLAGGRTIIQSPRSSVSDIMPAAAIAAVKSPSIVRGEQIGPYLWDLQKEVE
ncbi:MAG: chemotaxis protein CheB [Alteromonadaceae bacterium]|nr:MAG: chemotaxis protein CheB [Alteromonadaceae bacterium]